MLSEKIRKRYPENVLSDVFGGLERGYVYVFNREEMINAIDTVLNENFNEEQRTIFYGFYKDGQSWIELALSLKIGITVKYKLGAIYHKLRTPNISKNLKKFTISTARISKTTYVESLKCPRLAWLRKNGATLSLEYKENSVRIKEGEEVGAIARGYLGDFTLIDKNFNNLGELDIQSMINQTKNCIDNGTSVICEASFEYDGCFCAVDILRKVDGGYEIYEVKATTDRKPEHDDDITYQKYVLEKCGLNIVGTYLLVLNNEYRKKGDIDVKQLFKILDEKNTSKKRYPSIEKMLKMLKE